MTLESLESTTPALDLDVEIGNRVNALMFRARISQVALAPLMGLTQSGLSKKIRGNTVWTVRDLLTVAHVLGVAVSELLPTANDDDPALGGAVDVRRQGLEPRTRCYESLEESAPSGMSAAVRRAWEHWEGTAPIVPAPAAEDEELAA